MAWFDAILGGGAANSQGYINPAATPNGLMSSTSSSSSLAATQAGSSTAVSLSMLANSYARAQSSFSAHQSTMYTVMQYADAIGWDLTHHHLPVGMTSDDPKIAMLKLINVGEVLKDVGVRTSDTDYYVMREPSV